MHSHLTKRLRELEERIVFLAEDLRWGREHCEKGDFAGSLTKSRAVLERLLQTLARHRLGEKESRGRVEELLRSTDLTRGIPKRISLRMREVQQLGNLGAHPGEPLQHTDAEKALEAIAEILKWFADVEAPQMGLVRPVERRRSWRGALLFGAGVVVGVTVTIGAIGRQGVSLATRPAGITPPAATVPLPAVPAVPSDGSSPSSRPRGWERKKSGVTVLLHSIVGIGSHVLAVGDQGTVLRSNDGGETWERSVAPRGISDLFSVLAFQSGDVIVAGQGGLTARGTEFGRRWHPAVVKAGKGPIMDLWASGLQDVYAVGEDGVFHSTNGGATWSTELRTRETIRAVWGRSASDVWAVGWSGQVHRRDADRRWQRVPFPSRDWLWDVRGDGDGLWVVANQMNGNRPRRGTIHRSDAAATKWTSEGVAQGPLFSLAAAPGEAVAVGSNSTVLCAPNGCPEPWDPPPPGDYRGLWRSEAGDLFVIGAAGLILKRRGP